MSDRLTGVRTARLSGPRREEEISNWSIWGYLPVIVILLTVWLRGAAFAQAPHPGQIARTGQVFHGGQVLQIAQAGHAQGPQGVSDGTAFKLDTGKEIYEAACIGCHGVGGKGAPDAILGFTRPATFPDFSDCNGASPERMFDYRATVHEGGHGRGFSEIMPSFSEALTVEQIDKVVAYLRGLCTDRSWPPGELNLPRAAFTEKAFPENETVLTTSVNTTGLAGTSSELVFEKRLGAKDQLEVAVPFSFDRHDSGSWFGGVGDLVLGYKRVIFHSAKTGSIFSLQAETALPTGNKDLGFGSGVWSFQTFAAFGQRLPGLSFLQVQAGAELPTDTAKAPQAVFWRTAVGKTMAQNGGFGRSWTPMVEFLADRDLQTGAKTNWDIVPQMQVSLSKRQHILASLGVRFPANNTAYRATQVVFYVLWDWFDGGLRDGWK